MDFTSPLARGTLVARYKRFFTDVVLDDGGIGAVVAAADRLHVCRLQLGLGRCALKRHGVWTEPGLIFHDHDVTVLIDDQRSGGGY